MCEKVIDVGLSEPLVNRMSLPPAEPSVKMTLSPGVYTAAPLPLAALGFQR